MERENIVIDPVGKKIKFGPKPSKQHIQLVASREYIIEAGKEQQIPINTTTLKYPTNTCAMISGKHKVLQVHDAVYTLSPMTKIVVSNPSLSDVTLKQGEHLGSGEIVGTNEIEASMEQ
jgi:hypothetical protein